MQLEVPVPQEQEAKKLGSPSAVCENGPSFLAWKQVPPVAPPRVLVSKMCTSNRTAVFALFRSSLTAIHALPSTIACVCISCRSQRKHARHIASIRDMLHIESSGRFRRVNTCRAHMRIRGACLGRSCACKIGPSFSTCMPIFSLYVAAKMLHMSKFGRRFRHAPILAVCQGGIKSFTPFARRTSYAKC